MTDSSKLSVTLDEVVRASRTFKKRDGRHTVKRQDLAYCSFSTGRFTVTREQAQRDGSARLERFGLRDARGLCAIDLGCHVGAMLFELNRRGLLAGRGLEGDLEKVQIARRLAEQAGLTSLTFEHQDLDQFDGASEGQFDIVLALAIEAHVNRRNRLFDNLARLTRGRLYFEGNANCSVEDVTSQLAARGFTRIRTLGQCDDDAVASNNRRPIIVADRAGEQTL